MGFIKPSGEIYDPKSNTWRRVDGDKTIQILTDEQRRLDLLENQVRDLQETVKRLIQVVADMRKDEP
jgi:hypothetical protein